VFRYLLSLVLSVVLFAAVGCKKNLPPQSETKSVAGEVGEQLAKQLILHADDFLKASKEAGVTKTVLNTFLDQIKNLDTEGRGIGRLLVNVLQDAKVGDDVFNALFLFRKEVDGFSKPEFVRALNAAHNVLDDALTTAKASGNAQRIGFLVDNGVHVNGILEDIMRNRSALIDDITKLSGSADEASRSFGHLYLAMAWHDVGKVIDLQSVPKIATELARSPTLKEKPYLKNLALQMLHEEGSIHALGQAVKNGDVSPELAVTIKNNFRNHNDGSGHAGVWWNNTMKSLWPDFEPALPKTMIGSVAALFDRNDQPMWLIVSRNPNKLGGGAVKISNVYQSIIKEGDPGKLRSVLEQGVATNIFGNFKAAQQGTLQANAVPLAGSIRQVVAMGNNGHPFGRILRGMSKYRETLQAAKEMELLYKKFINFSDSGDEVFVMFNGKEVFRGKQLSELHTFLESSPPGAQLAWLEYLKRAVTGEATTQVDSILRTLNTGS
jgi:hypothetical protein